MELGVFESPGKEWDEFALQHTDLIFYQSIWSEVLRRGLGGQPLYFCLREGSEIVAGLPGVLLNFKIFRILYASIPYGHLIGEKAYYPAFLELLEKEFRRRGVDQVRLAESPFSQSYWPESFDAVPANCTLLDLRAKEKIWESYRSDVRRAVRKAQNYGFSIRGAREKYEMEIFYQLYRSSMDRNRAVAKYPPLWFDTLFDVLIQQNKADVLFAIKDDQYAAGVVLVYSESSLHYLHNGSLKTHLENRPNDLIIDYIIRHGVEEGKSTLDFMGSDPHDLSLLRFKEKWGSHSVGVRTYVKNYRPFRARILELGRRFAASNLGSEVARWIQSRSHPRGVF